MNRAASKDRAEHRRMPLSRAAARCAAVACGLFLVILSSPAPAANEAAFKQLWETHLGSPGDHTAVIEASRAFVRSNPGDPLIPVVHGIEAWHLFQERKNEEAARLLAPYLTPRQGAIQGGARIIARGWFTRLDREKVAQSLKAYYRKEAGFPKSLNDIVSHPKIPPGEHPPLKDRFGNPWQYRLTGFDKLPGFEDQRYESKSATLGRDSALGAALERDYAEAIEVKPLQVWDRNPPILKIDTGSASATAISPGQSAGDLYLAYVGREILVLCNHSHWIVLPRP